MARRVPVTQSTACDRDRTDSASFGVIVASTMNCLLLAEGAPLGQSPSRATCTEPRPASFRGAIEPAFPDTDRLR
jgi:hypothetical protein